MIEVVLFLLALVLVPLFIVIALQAIGAVLAIPGLLVIALIHWIGEIARRLSRRGQPQGLQ